MAGWGLSCKSQLAVRLCLLYRDYHGGGGRLAARPAAMVWWISGKTFLT